MKTLGIVGGMGPLATADLFRKIVINTHAKCDSDHLRILVDNNPSIPDRTEAIAGRGPSPVVPIVESIRKLAGIGAEIIAMPCNTVHYYFNEIQSGVSVPVINMIQATSEFLKNANIKKLLVLSTSGTINGAVYDEYLSNDGLPYTYCNQDEQMLVSDMIYSLKSGNLSYRVDEMKKIIDKYQHGGVSHFLLACTELPLYFAENGMMDGSVIDPTEILAKKAITECL